MRCALCGGEIDSKTKQCLKCGECWGGGNRGVAREVSRDIEKPYTSPEKTFTEKCISAVKNALSPVDKIITDGAGKVASALKIKATPMQNRAAAYTFLLAVLAILIIVPTVCSTACSSRELYGRWVAEGSSGAVSIELSKDGDFSMYVLSGDEEKLYRSGSYSVNKSLLEIQYDDGESITMTYELSGDTAVFTLLSTGQSQTYIRK